jgi:hypothetical protein
MTFAVGTSQLSKSIINEAEVGGRENTLVFLLLVSVSQPPDLV